MPNFLYATARSKFLWGGISWTTQNFGILFLNGSAASTGGSANPSYGTTGIGTTGWQGTISNNGPFLADVLTGWRASGSGNAGIRTELNSNLNPYISGTGVSATPFVPWAGGLAATVDGAARANNITFAAVAQSFGTLTAFVLYRNNGTEANSDLVAYFDQATNLPIPCNGGDITVQWSTALNFDYIFKL